MNDDMPCLCAGAYRCNRCRQQYWQEQHGDARVRMANNRLRGLANNDALDDDQWCVLMYVHLQDDLDLLLFQGDM